ncbi:peptide-methionine (S)-S-oxide reductase MsrA [Caldimonas thermodepolymerans]|jgi:peptide-methionine (S)-S-oxide reductase|uniref:Peptide methionine sulfoxide reductase MsrA n=1 Tax=Caldimonas thermodepolymerans TaxID=215580 RepID=A0A2S5T9A7_9BURK|nr:peptide-methionine (S)-S-oxide reductase MsrA [Caldimonas thermodepolymerans]PPE71594.1 peptide-methionine (S)-S-oxide reductase [Caldimonas thermodepolymerans]QPC30619.1 peptide-methionine (S)-S-oxide reductase MsrA [Caldimonas thermodepolymerans]RDI02776.1 peptide-methionine (S)-S-oxide reductase [Caldimonas thermodepolymerans]TCP08694.1 peptide-methionine (S)-S-oxide reductase [Caldimonas thermodepolymerans]UZG43352.1 peptide-methionine (S)-S-oxide reductase MsrA [Caldimonas thermodepoly
MSHARTTETITLGGGCFWCTEAVYDRVEGVLDVESGYANGHVDHPTYEQVCTGTTGHAEVVKVEFDPSRISLREILEIFFVIHDPTTPDRQGNDVGPQYRSAIYFHAPEQETVIRGVVAHVAAQLFDRPVVTEIAPLRSYWPAEDYHQNYFEKHPQQGYCAFVVAPKVEKFRQTFANKVRRA